MHILTLRRGAYSQRGAKSSIYGTCNCFNTSQSRSITYGQNKLLTGKITTRRSRTFSLRVLALSTILLSMITMIVYIHNYHGCHDYHNYRSRYQYLS